MEHDRLGAQPDDLEPLMTNVIPLFESRDRPTRGLPHTEATTHFLLEHPANESMRTLCGREGVGYLDKDNAYPACGRCVAEWTRLSGWAFPLPEVVCTD